MAELRALVLRARAWLAARGGHGGAARGPARVAVNAAVLARLRSLAAQARPYELCGVLRVAGGGTGHAICGARVLPNRAANPRQNFRLDRRDVERTRRDWGGAGTLGVFHTHGACDATPSAHDIATMRRHPGVHLIIGARGDVRVFANDGQHVHECPLVAR